MYSEDEFLALSGVQHFSFCRRQWALIHVEQLWEENILTVQGDLMHQRAHDEKVRERRGDTLVVRGLSVRSGALGLSGKCDVVEFHADDCGHPLVGEDGLWHAIPIEYKRGRSKTGDSDRLQLCAQAFCLEEMLGCDISHGFLFYGETKSRERIDFDLALRQQVVGMAAEMHRLYERRYTPQAKPFAACRSCSLRDVCLPKVASGVSVASYVAACFEGEV